MQPRDLFEDEDEGDHGAPDPNDDADWEHGGGAPSRADPLDPLSDFIKELQGLSTMSGPDISAIIADLPVPDDAIMMVMWICLLSNSDTGRPRQSRRTPSRKRPEPEHSA
jgi:hypothetical protein